MATQQEVLEIVTDFMLNAPPGEFLDVVHDIRGLLADESILNSTALPTFREYNTDHMIQVAVPVPGAKDASEQYQVLITKDGQVSENEYIDHRGQQVLIFDHFRQQVVGQRPIRPDETDAEGEPMRAALDYALEEYVLQHFPTGTGAVYCSSGGGGGSNSYVLCISSGAFQPHNYWNGRWRSRWELVYPPSSGGVLQLRGSVRLHVHYYEDGNVQMRGECPLQASVAVPAEPQTWEEVTGPIVKAIEKAEAEFQKKLNDSYEMMGDTTFKALRRILPITRSKIDWSKLPNYKMGSDISEYTMD